MSRAPRFELTASCIVDRTTGLAWELGPSPAVATWADAVTAATAMGGRLPGAAELMRFLMELAAAGGATLPADAVVWSASASPFARTSLVRAVTADGDGRLGVVLRERSAPARRWAVLDERQPRGLG